MNQNNKMKIIMAVYGVVLGILLTMCYYTIKDASRNRYLKVQNHSWQKLNLIMKEIQNNYVDTVNVKDLTEAAVTAALGELDPHSVYLPPVDLKRLNSELAGKFYGIGIQFNVPNDTAVVMDVIKGGPAEKVGLIKGDRIIKVDGKKIAGVKFPKDSMVFYMKGDKNTKVNIVVKRGKDFISYSITRGNIPIHCIDTYYMINDTTGYIRLSKFTETTYKEFTNAANELKNKGMKHLIFDLRDNSGGYFAQAFKLANEFLKKNSLIVYLKGVHTGKEEFKANGTGKLQDIKLTILINENSASSSEIFAGAIQDNDRGVIIGRRSFGKGLVQEPINFSDGSGIRLTVARYYTPSGRCIQKPYGKDYRLEVYMRYADGEMFHRDSIKINKKELYHTVGGRDVYGGGGIIPDIYVPIDTTNITKFLISCNKKTVQIRFSAHIFDLYKKQLIAIDNIKDLNKFLDSINIPNLFVNYATKVAGVKFNKEEWDKSKLFIIAELRALIGRYSKLGDVAFYTLYQPIDYVLQKAIISPDVIKLHNTSKDSLLVK